MRTLTRKPKQLTLAVAVLAIVAVAAVMLLAGSGPAQATTASLSPVANEDGGAPRPLATATPRTHATPEPCPGATGNPNTEAAHVVDSGHIALFDVWWNPEELELTNSSCPPTVEHVAAGRTTPAQDNRTVSNINIDETIIHIPNSARVDLSAADTPYPKDKYPDLWKADQKENRDINGDGTPDNVGDGIVWALPACPPEGTAGTGDLCISFSAALLNATDWLPVNDAEDKGGIVYHLDHIHQTDIDKQDPRYTLAYDAPEDGANTEYEPHWDSSDAHVAKMRVEPGAYERPMLFFTDRGTYELQVHITGEPDQDIDDPIAKELSVNDDVREYIIHVGAEADLGVGLTVAPADSADTSLDPGDKVTVTVTASHEGSETAPETKVDVSLPPEFMISQVAGELPSATKGAYADGVWTIGSMCNPAEPADPNADPPKPVCPQQATLTITASVAAQTHGQTLTAEATISATETLEITETEDGSDTVKTYHVPVADPTPGNDTAEDSITVARTSNVDACIDIMMAVPENSSADTLVGEVWVYDPDDDPNDAATRFTHGLDGAGNENFVVGTGAKEGDFAPLRISVSDTARLDYEARTNSYLLKLWVKDGKDTAGNNDDAIDSSICLWIKVSDVPEDAERQVPENSAVDTQVGGPITIAPSTGDLELSGHGHAHFKVARTNDGKAQLSVAEAYLDHEVRAAYHLTIGVVGDSASEIDVQVAVTDVSENDILTLTATPADPSPGDSVALRVSVGDLPNGASVLGFAWQRNYTTSDADSNWTNLGQGTSPLHTVTHSGQGTARFRASIAYSAGHGTLNATSNVVEVAW